MALALAALATASLFQGVVDVALPMSKGEQPFAFTFALTERLGPGVLYLSILVHNLGLAGLLPGVGFVAAMFEPRRRLRRLIAPILLGASVLSTVHAFAYLFLGAGEFDLRFALPLFLAEATAVVGVGLVAYDAFPRFDAKAPEPEEVGRAVVGIAPPLFTAAVGLIVLATLETLIILGH